VATKSRTKIDLKTVQTPFYATVGVTDLAVEAVREYVADVQARVRGYQKDVQKTVAKVDLQPKVLRDQAVTVLSARVDALTALSGDAKAVPAKVQTLVDENVAVLNDTYGDLVKRGESLVGRIRRQQSTQQTVKSAETTVSKAKTTKTQATKATKTTAKKATSTAKKQSASSKSSAKATVTAAKKTASSATQAVADAAEKVGD
jgi:Mg-chelatase subunit ChlI